MHALYYIDLMVRAVTGGDSETLASLGQHLEDCEEAKQILRAKGYGCTGMPVGATARLVPNNE